MPSRCLCAAVSLAAACAGPALADDNLPPFDFSDAFYTANGINPAAVVGRPTGQPPNSVIDNRENGPNFNNVRILAQAAAYDHSGDRVFFSVTGLLNENAFLSNQAGQQARQIAEEFKVYEFPRAANAPFAVFPKRQDLVADMRHGYFSNDPLGIWQVNIVRFTPAATGTPGGQQALAQLAARNGLDLDGTPIIKTVDEVEDLAGRGFVTIAVPPNEPGSVRWFFCPVIEDPRDGAIAPDAHLDVTENSDAAAFRHLFDCLQRTGEEDCSPAACYADCNADGTLNLSDFGCFQTRFATGQASADCNGDGQRNLADFGCFQTKFALGCP